MSMMEADMLDPGLRQAVKIVLKYEIQSLLSRLSDNGEEYIVITASSEDQTCDQICSSKGEEFVQCASLDGVKESFLNFCANGESSGPNVAETNTGQFTDHLDSFSAASEMKKNKRKSAPRRVLQSSQSIPDQVPSENRNYVMMYKDESSMINTAPSFSRDISPVGKVLDTALDLSSEKPRQDLCQSSDKSNDSVVSNDNCLNENRNPVNSAVKTDSGAVFVNGEVKLSSSTYQWMAEKIDLKPLTESLPNLGLMSSGLFVSNYMKTDNAALASNISPSMITEQVGDGNLGHTELGVGFANKNKPRRKSKKLFSPLTKQEDGVSLQTAVADGQSDLKTTVEEMRKAKSTKRLAVNSEFTDMKRAFIEIGNMAKCLICNKVLANKNNRTFHWRSHVGDKRFSCDICHKAFTHPSNMRSHRKIHTDEKPFPCSLCERRFRRRDYLLQHLERFHYNSKPVKSEAEVQSPVTLNGAANVTI